MKKLLSILLVGSGIAISGGALAADPAPASSSKAATVTNALEAGTKPATVKRFINHVDHVCWLTRDENLDAAAKKMAAMAGVKWDGPNVREALGIRQYLSWEAGLEIIAPQAGCTTDLCKQLNAVLETRGEGIWSVIIGKPNIREAVADVRKKGYDAGEPFNMGEKHWTGKTDKVWEAFVGDFLGTQILYSDIVYKDGVIATE